MLELSPGCVPVTGIAHKLVGKFVGKIHFLEIWKKMKNPQPL